MDEPECRATLLSFGFLEWQVEGILELYAMVNAGAYSYAAYSPTRSAHRLHLLPHQLHHHVHSTIWSTT